MSLSHAVLGFLSWQPLTGYDLKKIFNNSIALYWSGNNNQIYTALVQLERDGYVTHQVQVQESGPAKKIYTLTPQGKDELRRWVLSQPEAPELRNSFLLQLAWADLLTPAELDDLLDRYAEEVRIQLRMLKEKTRVSTSPLPAGDPRRAPGRTPREAFLSAQVAENVIAACEKEMEWLERLRSGLAQFSAPQETESQEQ